MSPHSTRLTRIFSSKWDGLNPNLIAEFFEVERVEKPGGILGYQPADDSDIVRAPLIDADLSASISWTSPFETTSSQQALPTMKAMLESGVLAPMLQNMGSGSGFIGKKLQQAADIAQKFEGRTGITKLNSMQVLSGMPPVKFSVTALFSAWIDPLTEVEDCFDRLMTWALPAHLEEDGSVLSRTIRKAQGDEVEVFLPSKAPSLIGMHYKGCTYLPLVIESISKALDSPIDFYGRHVSLAVPMTLCTLSAIDRSDWANIRSISRIPRIRDF